MPVFVDFKHQSLPRQMNVQSDAMLVLAMLASRKPVYYGPVWFVAKCATLCLKLVVRIE
jgi:hypothetical protein